MGEEEQLLELSNHDFSQGIARLIEYVMNHKDEKSNKSFIGSMLIDSSSSTEDNIQSFVQE